MRPMPRIDHSRDGARALAPTTLAACHIRPEDIAHVRTLRYVHASREQWTMWNLPALARLATDAPPADTRCTVIIFGRPDVGATVERAATRLRALRPVARPGRIPDLPPGPIGPGCGGGYYCGGLCPDCYA